jgi:hypothetical protein
MATENGLYDAVSTIIPNKLHDRLKLFNLRPAFVYSNAENNNTSYRIARMILAEE